MFWQILPSISLYVWFLEGFDLYIYIKNKFTTSWTSMFDVQWEILFWEILLPPLALIKHVHDVINLLYYKHWTEKWKCIPYIYVTHKSCRSKMATLEHDVCDVHGASSSLYVMCTLYIKTYWQGFYRVFPTRGMGESLHPPKIYSFTPSPPNIYSLPPKVNSTQLKNKNVIFSCSHCSCTIFILISYSFETQIMLIFIWCSVFTKCCF